MKKLVLFLVATVIVTVASSQVVTIKVTQSQLFVKKNKNTTEAVISTPDSIGLVKSTVGEYVIDLDCKTSTFYDNGVFMSVLKFKSITITGDTVRITFSDRDKYGSFKRFTTILYFNVKLNMFNYTYYSKSEKLTKTIVATSVILTSN